MKVLVFGKTGQVASELGKQAEVIALGREHADLTDPGACAMAIHNTRADVVINAAAYTAVDKAEDEETTARVINADAPGAMAEAAADRKVPFLHVSTDYVFAGTGTAPWAETDPVSPQNAYGRTKLAGEQLVQAAGGNHAILRTSWVFSAQGANFVRTMLRLAETHESLNVVDDQIGGPTPAADIAATLLTMAKAMVGGKTGGVYHYSGAPETSWAEFAREIFARAGHNVSVKGIPSSQYPTPAARPLNSRLSCAALNRDFGISQPDWRVGLDQVLKELDRGS